MRKLQTKTNVITPDATYPFGRIKNNPGNNTGTPFDESLYGDIQQFFEKMFAESGLTANGLPDNDYSGFQLFDALRIAAPRYYAFTATASQTGAADPVVQIWDNELGISAFVRTGTGVYSAQSSISRTITIGSFCTVSSFNFGGTTGFAIIFVEVSGFSSQVTIKTYNTSFVLSDSVLNNASIEVRLQKN